MKTYIPIGVPNIYWPTSPLLNYLFVDDYTFVDLASILRNVLLL